MDLSAVYTVMFSLLCCQCSPLNCSTILNLFIKLFIYTVGGIGVGSENSSLIKKQKIPSVGVPALEI